MTGAVAQTLWNHAAGLPSTHGINDIDLIYFDGVDLSEKGEAQHAARIQRAFSELPVWIDVKKTRPWFTYGMRRSSDIQLSHMFRRRMPSLPFRQQPPPSICGLPMASWNSMRLLGSPIYLAESSVQTKSRSLARYMRRKPIDGSVCGQIFRYEAGTVEALSTETLRRICR